MFAIHKFPNLLMILICLFAFPRIGYFPQMAKNLITCTSCASKLCNSAQFWPFHRKVRNDEKNARKNSNARDGDMWDIQAPYCSGIGLKLRLDTRKMDICNIPPYCSTREIDLIKDHPLQGTLQTPCRTFPNIWKILKY